MAAAHLEEIDMGLIMILGTVSVIMALIMLDNCDD